MDSGSLLHNRYRIADTLGIGGMGAVYRAIDDTLGVQVAVKENLSEDEEYVRQFRREATIMANLRHPNLPRVTDHFVIKNQGQYLVMDYIEGEDLKERLDRQGVLHQGEAMMIGVTICDALNYLHTHNPPILHRDIKPGNIKITPSGHVFLVDFGLAKILQGSGKTTIGAQGLTPGFSPPEQYGSSRTDARSDIYSLGATLYVTLTGVSPEESLSRMMDQSELTPIRNHNPDVSVEIGAAVEKALEIQSEDRYQAAEDFRQALLEASDTAQRRVVSGETAITPPPAEDGETRVVGQTLPISSGMATVSREEVVAKKGLPKAQVAIFSVLTITVLAALVYFVFPGFSGQSSGDDSGNGIGGAMLTETQLPVAAQTQFVAEVASATAISTDLSLPTSTATISPTPLGGGGGQIAFASDRSGTPQIWLVNIDGTGLFQLTDDQGGACQPDWAPDGTRLVFVSPCLRNQASYPGSSLFVINADGTGFSALPSFPGGDYDPSWSPSGAKIAFTSLRDGGRPQIWALDLETNEVTNVSSSVARDFQPSWSPDGELIVFTTTRLGESQIWFMDSGGNGQDEFTRSDDYSNSEPAWSPDGEVILFTQRDLSGGITWLSAAPWDGGGASRGFSEFFAIGDSSERNQNPMREANYSPDGFWLAVSNNPEGNNHDIYIMTTSGARFQRLTSHPGADFDPSWRPVEG
jgi:serine/threonine protein kinase